MNKSRLTLTQTKDLGLKTNVKDIKKCKNNYLTSCLKHNKRDDG